MSGSAKDRAVQLSERIGYKFRDPSLLLAALTHGSHGARVGRANERLEFLGDRVLGLVISELLYRRFPEADEGELTHRYNRIVRKEACAEVARAIGLDSALRTGKRALDLTSNATVLADICEALVAALFLDGGITAARDFIETHWGPAAVARELGRKDPKTALQEWALARRLSAPTYVEVDRTGPDHDPLFVMEVAVEGFPPQRGEGRAKRFAEQDAALQFLTRERIW